MAGVGISGLRKRFGGAEILRGIDVDIADGEMLVVLGPSGCGKSTLLRCIAGLETVDGGEIRIGGRRVNELEPMHRDIAMVFQSYALYPHMTVFDNMAYGLRNRRMARAEIERRVAEAAGLLGLGDLLRRRPRQLSGGQRQRVAMGRAIVRDPAVFLFDEPLSNLDAKLRVQMRHEIKALQHRLGGTFVYVTHDQVEAMTLGDRLLVMDAGQVEQLGTPLEIYARPATTFVAGFIGSPPMNLLPGRIGADGRSVIIADRRLPLLVPEAPGSAVLVGIRPESLVPGDPGDLKGVVAWVEVTGADALASVRLDGDFDVTVRLDGRLPPAPGSAMSLSARADALHLFDPSSGRRISATPA
ncbi:MAG: sn-glycerol-3-phosphate ABC transporter ATP-binding protein UgpC [Geminicoccaceae bacterium]